MHILVVEDEPRVADFVRRGLQEEGHAVEVVPNGESAMARVHADAYDVIVLDVGLPDRSGVDVTTALRADAVATPILMLTAHDAPDDIVRGLNAGADDYLTKPFDFAELVARVRALGRRAAGGPAATLRGGDIHVDRLARDVRRAGTVIRLTPIEYRLLEVLMTASGNAVSRAELLQRVWGMTFDPGRGLIDVHIANLRHKLEQGGGSRVIAAVKAAGFRFDAGGV